ncbi:hypothetical protein IMSAGC014_01170 [Bacteroidaceae bacterium]|nr:hypothetical protein IMSAGC014_01170 [Bacteroidaceae bacterium]
MAEKQRKSGTFRWKAPLRYHKDTIFFYGKQTMLKLHSLQNKEGGPSNRSALLLFLRSVGSKSDRLFSENYFKTVDHINARTEGDGIYTGLHGERRGTYS